jgi:hypothetical protein
MTTAIYYRHTRARTTEHVYDVEVNGVIVAAANNQHAAELVALEVEGRNELIAMAAAFAQAGREQSITVEGMELHAPAVRCQEPDDLCSVDDPCPAHAAAAAAYLASEGPGMPAPAEGPWAVVTEYDEGPPSWGPACPCGDPAVFFVQYPHRVYAYCPECYGEQKSPPLLAQCAAVIRRCLGSTTGAGGIIEELRRVDQTLSREGW